MIGYQFYLISLAIAILAFFVGKKISENLYKKNVKENIILVDTSSLIDGRILEVAKTAFLSGTLIVPKFILHELQQVADSEDHLKRSKGRRGLKVLKELRKLPYFNVEISDMDTDSSVREIDQKLIKLAKDKNIKILTVDYNLNEVARIQDVVVLNINELSNAIKPVYLPGEETEVKVVQKGKERGQGVGYLEDGTMIVVEEGERFLGQTVRCLVHRIFQTEAGRIIFVKPIQNNQNNQPNRFQNIFKSPRFFHRKDDRRK
jgi:uncharacterized protein YacL